MKKPQKFMSEVDLGDVRESVEAFLPFSFTKVNSIAKSFLKMENAIILLIK